MPTNKRPDPKPNETQGTNHKRGHNDLEGNLHGHKSKNHYNGKVLNFQVKIDIINITHLINYGDKLKDRDFDTAYITEHSIENRQHTIQEVRDIFGKNAQIHLSKLDKEKNKNVAGTGTIQRLKKHIIMPEVLYPPLAKIINEGRIGLYGQRVSKDEVALIYLLYGYTGGEQNNMAASRTNDIVEMVLRDMELQAPGPKLLVGDYNATTNRINALKKAIQGGTLFDIGADCNRFGSKNCEWTCQANSNSQKTRRDFVLANAQGRNIISDFQVIHDTGIKTHSVIRIVLNTTHNNTHNREVNMPTRLQDILMDQANAAHVQNKLNHNNGNDNEDTDNKNTRKRQSSQIHVST